MKPFPQVGDLQEPAWRVALPHAPRLVVGQELASCPRRIRGVRPEGGPVLFFEGSGCWRHLRVPSPEGANSPGVIGYNFSHHVAITGIAGLTEGGHHGVL